MLIQNQNMIQELMKFVFPITLVKGEVRILQEHRNS